MYRALLGVFDPRPAGRGLIEASSMGVGGEAQPAAASLKSIWRGGNACIAAELAHGSEIPVTLTVRPHRDWGNP